MAQAQGKPEVDFYIRNIAHSLRYVNEQKVAEYGITDQQARLLGALRRSLFEGVTISRKYLQDRLELSGPSITSLLNGLEKNRFIVRSPGAQDGRAITIQVTEKGMQILGALDQVFMETRQKLLEGMTEEEQNTFIALLQKAYRNMTQSEDK